MHDKEIQKARSSAQRQILADLGCILEGNYFIALKDGMVTKKYVDVGPLLARPDLLEVMVEEMLRSMPSERLKKIDTVVGPAPIGIAFAYATARAYQRLTGHLPNVAFAEEVGNKFEFKRKGFKEVIRGKNVLVIGGMGSTGLSTAEIVNEVRALGGKVRETCFLWNRGNITPGQVGSPTCSLIDEVILKWIPEECPEWGELPLVTDIGHPEYFPDYKGGYISLLK